MHMDLENQLKLHVSQIFSDCQVSENVYFHTVLFSSLSSSKDILDIFDVKILHTYCRHFSEGKDTCHHSLQNESWLIIGIRNSTVGAAQEPLQQGNSLSQLLFSDVITAAKQLV